VQDENSCLKKELEYLKKKMKDDQEAQRKAFMQANEKEGALRESMENLLSKFLPELYDISFLENPPDTMNHVL
jgi:hypothetical protein